MLSWVVKVVPQPPDPSKKAEDQKEGAPDSAPPPVNEKKVTFQDECKNEGPKAKPETPTSAGNGPVPASQSGMLTWISSALPLPTAPPTLSRSNSTAKEEAPPASKPEEEIGMIAWISQGLEKVVPQPDLKNKDTAEPSAEVRPAAAPPAPPAPHPPTPPAPPAPEPQVTAKEVESDQTPASMMEWIKHGIVSVVPQPEIHSKAEANKKTEAPPTTKAPPPPPPPPAPKPATDPEPAKETEQQPNMMGWIVSGIGRMLPQPVPKPPAGSDEVQTVNIVQKTTDLVLEDVEEDEVKEIKEVKEEPQQQKETPQPIKKETDNAETQVDQLTPVVETIKKQAGEAALAHMEERLQQERLEAARVAEEMARKAAEEAVRQLEVEHSAKIIIETLPEPNEQLPNILEEENEDDPELQHLQEDSEDSTDNKNAEGNKVKEEDKNTSTVKEEKKPQECMVDICPADEEAESAPETDRPVTPGLCSGPTDHITPSSTEVEPASERREVDSPVTQEPEPAEATPTMEPAEAPPTTEEETGAAAETAEEEAGCGACVPIKSFVLQFPLAAECLESCRKLMHDLSLPPPALPTLPTLPTLPMPTMPTPPAELAQLTQELSQLWERARQHCTSTASRLTRLMSDSQHAQQP